MFKKVMQIKYGIDCPDAEVNEFMQKISDIKESKYISTVSCDETKETFYKKPVISPCAEEIEYIKELLECKDSPEVDAHILKFLEMVHAIVESELIRKTFFSQLSEKTEESSKSDIMECLKMYEVREEKDDSFDSSDEIKDYSTDSSSSVKSLEFKNCLKELGKCKFQKDDDISIDSAYTSKDALDKSDDLLKFLFENKKKLTLTEKEKPEVGFLISQALDSIMPNILFNLTKCIWNRKSYCIGKVRAAQKERALQYLLDDFSELPVESTTLATKFKEIDLKGLIQMLEEFRNEELPDDYESDYNEWYDPDDSDDYY